MRSITRQSSRLATPRAAITSVQRQHPRSTSKCTQRTFSSAERRGFWPRPPSDPQDPNNNKDVFLDQQAPNEFIEKENTESGSSSADKLKKTLRQRRADTTKQIPNPPPVPTWFLENNVWVSRLATDNKLAEVPLPLWDSEVSLTKCILSHTGETLFTLPWEIPQSFRDKRRSQKVVEDNSEADSQNGTKEKADNDATVHDTSLESSNAVDDVSPEEMLKRLQTLNTSVATSDVSPEEVLKRAQALNNRIEAQNQVLQRRIEAQTRSPVTGPFLESLFSIEAAMASSQEDRSVHSTSALSKLDLSLVCPDSRCHANMDGYVRRLAEGAGATVITFDANDFEELAGGFVGQDLDTASSYSNFGYDVYAGYAADAISDRNDATASPDAGDNAGDEAHDEADTDITKANGPMVGILGNGIDLSQVLGKVGILGESVSSRPPRSRRIVSSAWPDRSNNASHWEDTKIDIMLNQLIDAPQQRQPVQPSGTRLKLMSGFNGGAELKQSDISLFKALTPVRLTAHAHGTRDPFVSSDITGVWASLLLTPIRFWLLQGFRDKLRYQETEDRKDIEQHPHKKPKTIVHVRDLHDLLRTRIGEQIVRRLLNVVQKRREGGERVMVLGTTAQPGFGNWAYGHDLLDTGFRPIKIPGLNGSLVWDEKGSMESGSKNFLQDPAYPRILEINLRHIQSMLRRLRPTNTVDLFDDSAMLQMSQNNTSCLAERVLPMEQVQRLVQVALGLSRSLLYSDFIHPIHIGVATQVLTWSDRSSHAWTEIQRRDPNSGKPQSRNNAQKDNDGEHPGQNRVEEIRDSCTKREKRLLTGVVDASKIKTGFADVHVAPDTIQALKTLTSLSLLRPEAFKYGVLANDRLPGLLLYGPPGTGKTLLARAVAKESRATVLEISGAQIYEKYVGEGEKMVRAVFSLAKKLSPCVVFMDEADAIFSSRGSHGRNTHREIINQFLREWDGMDDHGVFVMVASNRPFDLDDAVLRRLPRRILVDLPEVKDRESILGIHLKDEALDPVVSLPQLAEQTPFYSGSDLKNLCVAAALACVREENDLLSTKKDSDPEFKLPEKRTLHPRHFDTAMAEISASISEDMGSLTAIRKFDEKFGDRKGRRKKSSLGFGNVEDEKVDEGAVRVRRGVGIGVEGVPPMPTVESAPAAKRP